MQATVPDSVIEQFTTARILATRLQTGDLAELSAMNLDPLVMRTLGGMRSPALSLHSVRENIAHWHAHSYGMWILRDPVSKDFIGRGMLRRTFISDRPETEIGYALLSRYWGQGLATEFVRKAAELAFAHPGITTLVAYTLPENTGSQRVLEKLGGRLEGEVEHVGLRHFLYRITR